MRVSSGLALTGSQTRASAPTLDGIWLLDQTPSRALMRRGAHHPSDEPRFASGAPRRAVSRVGAGGRRADGHGRGAAAHRGRPRRTGPSCGRPAGSSTATCWRSSPPCPWPAGPPTASACRRCCWVRWASSRLARCCRARPERWTSSSRPGSCRASAAAPSCRWRRPAPACCSVAPHVRGRWARSAPPTSWVWPWARSWARPSWSTSTWGRPWCVPASRTRGVRPVGAGLALGVLPGCPGRDHRAGLVLGGAGRLGPPAHAGPPRCPGRGSGHGRPCRGPGMSLDAGRAGGAGRLAGGWLAGAVCVLARRWRHRARAPDR